MSRIKLQRMRGMRAKQPKTAICMNWMYSIGLSCTIAEVLIAFGVVAGNRGKRVVPIATGNTGESRHPLAIGADFSGLPCAIGLSQRRLFPYSVIPGGIASAHDLQNGMVHDPLAARFYANFDFSQARIVCLDHEREVYVCYRTGDHIYWTKNSLRLRKGGAVIIDGTQEARTRCGNRISETPVKPVSPNEPPSAAMIKPPNLPLLAKNSGQPPSMPPDPLVLGSRFVGPPANRPISVIPHVSYPIVGGGTPSNPSLSPPRPPTPIAAPELNTLLLLVLGFLALSMVGDFTRVRKRRKA
jgi:hypothetical protein